MSLTDAQRETLLRPIKPSRVKVTQGNSYLEAYDVVAHLTRIFGFEGWDKTILRLEPLFETEGEKSGRPVWTVAYICSMRLTVRDPHGIVVKVIEDVGTGDAIHQPSRGDAHDLAVKSAVSGALKRCAISLGDQFGLGLYDNGSTEACVKRVVIYDERPMSTVTVNPPRVPTDPLERMGMVGAVPYVDGDVGEAVDLPPMVVRDTFPTPVDTITPTLLITHPMRQLIYAKATRLQIDPHQFCTDLLDKPVEHISELTKAEGHTVIDELTAMTGGNHGTSD